MPDNSAHGNGRKDRSVSRRSFVKAVGASGVAAGLAGCTDDDGGGGATTTSSDGSDGDTTTVGFAASSLIKENEDALNDALHEAGLSENIEVEIIAGSRVTDDRQEQYNQWLSAGRDEPALLLTDSGWTIPFIAREQVANLENELSSETLDTIKDSYFEASVATAQDQDGNLHGVPLFPDFPTMQYRKDLVEEAGYDPEGENWATESMSWERFAEVAKDVKEQTDTDHGYTFQADVYEGLSCCDFNEWLTSWGGAYFGSHENLFGPIGDRPITVDEDPVVKSLKMVRTFIHGEDDEHALDGFTGGIAPEATLQWTEEPSRKPFTNGDAVFHRNWPYSITINGADEEYGEDLGVMPIPYGVEASEAEYDGTGGPVAALGGWHVTLNPNAAKKDAALQVLEVLPEKSFQLAMFEVIGLIPPQPEVLASDEAGEVDVIGRYVDALRVAGENAVARPVSVVWPQQSEKIAQQANAALSGNKAPDQAMSDLKEELEAIENSV